VPEAIGNRQMGPARHRVTAPDDPTLLERLAAQLAVQGDPPICLRRATVLEFECATGPFMLRSRVADALMQACEHDQRQRLFRPLD
jgi:hypothetical protein